MFQRIPDPLLQNIVYFLRPEDALMLVRTNQFVRDFVQPLLKDIRSLNDGIFVGTRVRYRDYMAGGIPRKWPDWARSEGVVTKVLDNGTYVINRRIKRKSRDVRRLRRFADDICVQGQVSKRGDIVVDTCPGCFSQHQHGKTAGFRHPHCKYFSCFGTGYYLCV